MDRIFNILVGDYQQHSHAGIYGLAHPISFARHRVTFDVLIGVSFQCGSLIRQPNPLHNLPLLRITDPRRVQPESLVWMALA